MGEHSRGGRSRELLTRAWLLITQPSHAARSTGLHWNLSRLKEEKTNTLGKYRLSLCMLRLFSTRIYNEDVLQDCQRLLMLQKFKLHTERGKNCLEFS